MFLGLHASVFYLRQWHHHFGLRAQIFIHSPLLFFFNAPPSSPWRTAEHWLYLQTILNLPPSCHLPGCLAVHAIITAPSPFHLLCPSWSQNPWGWDPGTRVLKAPWGGGSPVWRQSTLQPTPQAGADLRVGVIYRPAKGKWGLRLEEPDVSYHSRLTGSPDAASHFLLSQLL